MRLFNRTAVCPAAKPPAGVSLLEAISQNGKRSKGEAILAAYLEVAQGCRFILKRRALPVIDFIKLAKPAANSVIMLIVPNGLVSHSADWYNYLSLNKGT